MWKHHWEFDQQRLSTADNWSVRLGSIWQVWSKSWVGSVNLCRVRSESGPSPEPVEPVQKRGRKGKVGLKRYYFSAFFMSVLRLCFKLERVYCMACCRRWKSSCESAKRFKRRKTSGTKRDKEALRRLPLIPLSYCESCERKRTLWLENSLL